MRAKLKKNKVIVNPDSDKKIEVETQDNILTEIKSTQESKNNQEMTDTNLILNNNSFYTKKNNSEEPDINLTVKKNDPPFQSSIMDAKTGFVVNNGFSSLSIQQNKQNSNESKDNQLMFQPNKGFGGNDFQSNNNFNINKGFGNNFNKPSDNKFGGGGKDFFNDNRFESNGNRRGRGGNFRRGGGNRGGFDGRDRRNENRFNNNFSDRNEGFAGFKNFGETRHDNYQRNGDNFHSRNEHIDDFRFFKDNEEIIEDIKKNFTFLNFNKVIEGLKIMKINLGITVFEILNYFFKENAIQKHCNSNQSFLRRFNDDIPIFESEQKNVNSSHQLILTKYKTIPITEGESSFNFKNANERRRKLRKDVDDYYNYIPIKCPDNHIASDNQNDNCIYAHNEYEINYHSLTFHTRICSNKDCTLNEYCPNSHGLGEDFRRIYNWKKKEIIDLTIKLENCSLLKDTIRDYTNYFPVPTLFTLETYKVLPCKLGHLCTKDIHLCYNYHELREKRRPPTLFKYSNEVCSFAQPEKNSDFYPSLCSKGNHCDKVHTRYELLYHQELFRKLKLCTRNSKGICPFIETCYGIHDAQECK